MVENETPFIDIYNKTNCIRSTISDIKNTGLSDFAENLKSKNESFFQKISSNKI